MLRRIGSQLNKKIEKTEKMKNEKMEKTLKNCTFTPLLTNKSRKICQENRKEPIHRRYKKEHKKKMRKIKKERIKKIEEIMKAMLKPKQPTSKENLEEMKTLEKKKDLYTEGKEWLQRRKEKILEIKSKEIEKFFEDEETMYTPRINKRSKSAIKIGFKQRQKIYLRRRDVNQKNIEKKEMEKFTYKPKINEKSLKIAHRRKKKLRELSKEKIKQGRTEGEKGEVKFYSDDSPQKSRRSRSNQKMPKSILKNSTKKVNGLRNLSKSQRERLGQEVVRRLYKTPGKENKQDYILAKRPERKDQAAVVIKEYQPKSPRRNLFGGRSKSRSKSPLGKRKTVSGNYKWNKKPYGMSRRKMGFKRSGQPVVYEIEFDEETADHLRAATAR